MARHRKRRDRAISKMPHLVWDSSSLPATKSYLQSRRPNTPPPPSIHRTSRRLRADLLEKSDQLAALFQAGDRPGAITENRAAGFRAERWPYLSRRRSPPETGGSDRGAQPRPFRTPDPQGRSGPQKSKMDGCWTSPDLQGRYRSGSPLVNPSEYRHPAHKLSSIMARKLGSAHYWGNFCDKRR